MDGALGFWTALREVFATTREQRCWVHKTMNVLNAMPESIQAKAKGRLRDIWQAETKAKANVAFDFMVKTYGVKRDKAVAKLVKDRDALLTLYDFPAKHRKHIRHRPSSNQTHQGMPQPQDRSGHGLQADDVGAEEMAKARRSKSPTRDHPRDRVPRRDPPISTCRLIKRHQLLPISLREFNAISPSSLTDYGNFNSVGPKAVKPNSVLSKLCFTGEL